MGTYTVNFIRQSQMQVYCTNACTGTCYIAETQKNSKIQFLPETTCYKVFSISQSFSADWKQVKIVDREHCMIAGLVTYQGLQKVAMLSLDTGAECNVVSAAKLCQIFQLKFLDSNSLQQTGVSLKTADNSTLQCQGQVCLTIRVGRNAAELLFYVINAGNVFLLGVPAIEQLGMVIDLPNHWCYLLGFADKKAVNYVKTDPAEENIPGSTMRQRRPKQRRDECPENYVIRLTPAKPYHINNLDPLRIRLEMLGEIKTCFLYKKVVVLDLSLIHI